MLKAILKSLLVAIILANNIDCLKNRDNELSKIKLKDNLFVDEYGRVKLFHGANYVNKGFPWYPQDLTNQTHLDNLKLWGFNSVRLGVMWTGLRPDIKTVNTTYLNIILKIIDDLSQRGIYVIIDLHQDMMSTKFGAYDGVPRWLVDRLPSASIAPYPWPFKNENLGFKAYLTDSCGSAFQSLYSNKNNFQDYLSEYWAIVSKAMSNLTSIIGYELINEPWAGDLYLNPSILLPGIAGRYNLMPMYDNLSKIIRNYDNETLIFYEPVTWGIILNGQIVGTGFTKAPGDDPSKTVLSWHYYCWFLQFNENPLKNNTFPMIDRIGCDYFQRELSFQTVKTNQEQIGGGAFLTEFGVCSFSKNNGTLDTTECEYVLNSADQYFSSWTYWDSNFYVNGIINIFSRVYPQSTSGKPIYLFYNPKSLLFIYEFEQNPTITEPTEIYVPEFLYPRGFHIFLSNNLVYELDRMNNLVLVRPRNYYSNQFLDAKIIIIPMQ